MYCPYVKWLRSSQFHTGHMRSANASCNRFRQINWAKQNRGAHKRFFTKFRPLRRFRAAPTVASRMGVAPARRDSAPFLAGKLN